MNQSNPQSTGQPIPWTLINQRYLYQCVQLLRQQLVAKTDKDTRKQPLAKPKWPDEQPPPALTTLCQILSLSPFEQGILLLCLAMDLDPSLAQVYAAIQGNPPRPYPTLHLALRCLANAEWNALTPAAPLRYWQLIEATGDEPLTTQALKLDERILHYLMGVTYLDPLIEACVMPLAETTVLPPSQQAQAQRIVTEWRRVPGTLMNLYGGTAANREAIAIAACQMSQTHPYRLAIDTLPTTPEQRTCFQRRWERDAALGNNSLLISLSAGREQPAFLASFLQRQRGRLMVSSDEPLTLPARQSVRLEVTRPSPAEQQVLWQKALGNDLSNDLSNDVSAHSVHPQLGQIISQFDLDPQGIAQVGTQLSQAKSSGEKSSGALGECLWQACRQQARITLDDLAQRLIPVASWEDLVLPQAQLQTLQAIVASVQQRSQVYDSWGFGQRSDRGLGISALFAGSSGTGKTMSAEVLAQALQLDLYRIDLSAVVSKYIGETEKNLRRIFDAAEQGGVILLFDEADALFGKRSEVKDSHDRHANIEVSYLLQRMETYRGLAILTTNFRNAIDPAFLRRIRFVVQFPFPDVAQRLELWQRAFPLQTPTHALDPGKLAQLTVPGGNIYSIAMNAAFLASAEALPVTMQHLLRAAQSEYTKLDKKLADAEVRGWI